MPIEVKELIVRAEIADEKGTKTTENPAVSKAAQKKLISACVEQVLRILEREQER